MATYSVTTTPRQDQVLTQIAAKRGVTVQALMDAELARVLQRAANEADRDDGAVVAAAYLAATNTKQAQVKTVLGLP